MLQGYGEDDDEVKERMPQKDKGGAACAAPLQVKSSGQECPLHTIYFPSVTRELFACTKRW